MTNRCFLLAVCVSALCLGAIAGTPEKKLRETPKVTAKSKLTDAYTHELWGQTSYGEGYVYGPTNRRSGMTAVDLDTDGDNDFVFPSSTGSPEWMLNLGSAGAFYPGGSRVLEADPLPSGTEYDLGLEFGDLNGDTLPDFVAIVRSRSPLIKRLVWFKNDGPRDRPSFSYQGPIYSSAQPGTWDGMFVTLGDLDNDKDLDLYVCEAFTSTSVRPHRLFVSENTGTFEAPQFAAATEVTAVSNLLPPRLEFSKVLANQRALGLDTPSRQKTTSDEKGLSFSYNLGDIGFSDWDLDGDSDFLFYHREDGLFWLPNVGTRSSPAWSPTLGNNGQSLYRHKVVDEIDLDEGSFANRLNPAAAKPGAEWTDETYLSVKNRLKTIRFYVGEGFRIVNQSAVSFAFGQGPAAFWDYDYDGDPDLFKTSAGYDPDSFLMILNNDGTAYTPAWNDVPVSLNEVAIGTGNQDNGYREDQYTFANYSSPGTPALFAQRQNGNVDLYFGFAPETYGDPPTFQHYPDAFPGIVVPGHENVAPAGIAVADFDLDGLAEIITVYQHSEGGPISGELVVVDLYGSPESPFYETYVVPNLLEDGEGNILDPSFIESMTAGDINLDGRPDLIVTTSSTFEYKECETFIHLNDVFEVDDEGTLFHNILYDGRLDAAFSTDKKYARMPALTDIDADGDLDLFVSHRYPDFDSTGLTKYLRYYRNGGDTGLKYVRFRVVSGREWPLTLQLTTGGGSQTETVAPEYTTIQNVSGGELLADANYRAGSFAPSVDIFETTDLRSEYGFPTEVRAFVDVLPEVAANQSKAIVVIGDTADGDLYPTFRDLAAFAYRVLISEGLPRENIRLYAATAIDADFDGANDVTGAPALSTLQNSVTTWGKTTQKLLVYLIDHGQRDRFRLNADEFLEAGAYDGWLDQIQASGQGPQVTTVIDTCESGSFLDDIKGPRRINITSAGVGPTEGVALFDRTEYISFSLNFWLRIYNGDTYGKAFGEAKTAIEALNPLQTPQIDDDGDGAGNAANDGLVAEQVRPGADFQIAGPTVFIGDIAPNQVISGNSTTLWLSGVVTPFPVEGAKAIIVPPNFDRPSLNNDDEQPVSNLPSVLFTFNENSQRWEGRYSGFTQGGLYQVQYFVKTGGQYYASPRIGFVDRINTPDAWENDNTPNEASWLRINSVQGHNFHQGNDEDWVLFTAPQGQATIALLEPRHSCQPVAQLYRAADLAADPFALPVRLEASEGAGKELVFQHNFAASEQYLLRITNTDPAVAGEGTSYLLIVAVGTGGSGIIPSSLLVTVLDSAEARVAGARVSFDGNNVGSTNIDGIAQAVVGSYGNYTISVNKEGFRTATQLARVNNILEELVVRLEVDDGEPNDKQGGCAACSGARSPGSLAGDAIVVLALCACLLAHRFRTCARAAA